MYRLLLAAAIVASACEETPRVVGASPSASRTTTTANTPTSSPTPRTSAPATTAAVASPSPARTATTAPSPTPVPSVPPASASPSASATPGSSPTLAPPPRAAPALGSCADEATARPQQTSATVTVPIVFSNQSGATRQYFSLDAQGARVLTRALVSGTSYTQTARLGDVWVVASGATCVALYRVTAAALVISSAQRQSVVPLYEIAGIVTDARTGAALSGQTVFIWQPEESACSVLGGAESSGYVVSSITGADGKYSMFVSSGDYKIRVRATAGHASQWWSLKPALTAGHCAAADVVSITGDTFQVNFPLQPQ